MKQMTELEKANAEMEPMMSHAESLLQSATVCDMLFGYLTNAQEEIQPFVTACFGFVSITVGGDDNAWPTLIFQRLARERQFYGNCPDQFILVDTVEDIRRAKREGKLAISFHFQGTEAIGRDLSLVGAYYKLGVRWMLLAYNFQNNVGVGCIEAQSRDLGLSDFGKQLIAEMNRIGMIVDLSHTGLRTTLEAIEASNAPCIFSHSNADALNSHPRNITDEQIRAVAETGGIIGVNGVGSFMNEPRKVKAESVFKHIDYIVQLVGIKHVALGLDYMSPACCDHVYTLLKGDLSRVGMMEPPWAFFHPKQIMELTELMVRAGYNDDHIHDVLGENFIRIASDVWR